MRQRRFLALWASTGGANLADGITLFLLPVAAVLSGASPAGVAAVTVVGTLAWPVLGLPAGWIVDRVDRGRLLVAANVLRAVVVASVATAAAIDGLGLPVLLGAAAVAGALEAVVDSALTALVPTVVDEADRTRANARIETTINLTNQLIGAPLAGLLAGIALSTAFGAAAALYAAAGAVALALLSGPRAVAPSPVETTLVDARVRAGLVYLWAHPLLRQLTLVTAAMNMVWGAFGAVFVIYALAPSGLDLGPTAYGLLFTGAAVGGLVASATADPLRRRFGARNLLLVDCIGTTLLVGPSALALGPWPVAAGVVVAGAGSSIWRVLVATIRQAVAPDELLGRIYSASRVISIGTVPLGAAAAGLLAEVAGVRTALGAATVLAVAVIGWFLIGLRSHDLDAAFAAPALDSATAQPTT